MKQKTGTKKWDLYKLRQLKKNILFGTGAILLLLQLLIILQPKKYINDLKTWPLLRYPMFAQVKYPGDTLVFYKLVLFECENKRNSFDVDYHKLGIMRKRYNTLLRKIHKSDEEALNLLNNIIVERFSNKGCIASILYKEYKLSSNGLIINDVQWKTVIEWNFNNFILEKGSLLSNE